MTDSRVLIDELERLVQAIERLWPAEPPRERRRELCDELGSLEGEVRHLLLRARCGTSDDEVWAQTLRCGRRLDRLRSDWHRNPLAA
jgi:hypothetical protein